MNEKDERDLLEMMRTQAKMARAYYDALMEQNFVPNEAMRLTMAFITRRTD
jgi:hypothetical protein